ncbi:MAG: aconitate hydratase, partial [Candidatus Omnitrophica bacterium]|nr:aconitate hydratase [Candidatus Omnitrophota bacterium]
TFKVVLKAGDNISTDHILPGGSKILPLRSNIPAISQHVFAMEDPDFVKHTREALEEGGSAVVGGINYGQGSSREHAAMAPMYLGIRCVLAKSFARIHRSNLINFGILPLVLKGNEDYALLKTGDILKIEDLHKQLKTVGTVTVKNITQGTSFKCASDLTKREAAILLAGGLLNYTKGKRDG